jgi:hypothetical protein
MIRFLQEGDELVADTAIAIVAKNDVIAFDGWGECGYTFNGYPVKFEDSGRPYIEYE